MNDTKLNVFQKHQYRYTHEQRLCEHVANLDGLKPDSFKTEKGKWTQSLIPIQEAFVTDTY